MRAHAISYCFPPAPYAQSPQVARFLAMAGCEVVVHAADEGGDESLLATVGAATVVVRHGWGVVGTGRRILRRVLLRRRLARPDAYRPWADHLVRRLRSAPVGADDVLLSFGQPMSDHLVGLALKRRSGARWVAHLSDPWLDNPYTPLGPVASRVQARQEAAVVAAADVVVVTTDEQAAMLRARHPGAVIVVVPHVHDARPTVAPAPALPGPVVARYLGAFYGPRSPRPLLDAVAALVARGDADASTLRVELVGPGSPPPDDDRFPSGMVAWRPAVPYAESLELMAAADLLLVVDAPAAHSVFLPSKLVDYLGARRPILGITPEGPAARLVRAAGGWVADPADAPGTVVALEAALAGALAHRGHAWGDEAVVAAHAVERVGPVVRALLAPDQAGATSS